MHVVQQPDIPLVSALSCILLSLLESNAAVLQGDTIVELWTCTLHWRLHDEGDVDKAVIVHEALKAAGADEALANVLMPVPACSQCPAPQSGLL